MSTKCLASFFWHLFFFCTAAQPGSQVRGPASAQSKVEDIIRDYARPGEVMVAGMDAGGHQGMKRFWNLRFRDENGRPLEGTIVESTDGFVHVDTSGMEAKTAPANERRTKARGGDLVYQTALTYAHNNGLRFRPDPSSVSPMPTSAASGTCSAAPCVTAPRATSTRATARQSSRTCRQTGGVRGMTPASSPTTSPCSLNSKARACKQPQPAAASPLTACATIPKPIPSGMRLDESKATELLQTPWQNWTPQQAESVRRHFLGTWYHKAHCADKPLGHVLHWMRSLFTWGPQNQKLREAAAHYVNSQESRSESLGVISPSSTANPPTLPQAA